MDLLCGPKGPGSQTLQDCLMIAGYASQRGFPVRFYIQLGYAEGESVLDERQLFECRESLYRNVSHSGVSPSLEAE